jgi:hypothetical protein
LSTSADTPAGDGIPADFVRAYSSPNNADSWAARNRHLFATDVAFRWFLRRHRSTLVDAGALVMIAGRWHVSLRQWPAAFEACVRTDTRRAVNREPGDPATPPTHS